MLRPGQISRDVASVPTEVVLQVFVDRTLILITQLGKVGILTQAFLPSNTSFDFGTPLEDEASLEKSPYSEITLPQPPASIALTPLLGTSGNSPLLSLYTSQIATLVWAAEAGFIGNAAMTRPVVVGLALRGGGTEDPLMFHGVMRLVHDLLEQPESER